MNKMKQCDKCGVRDRCTRHFGYDLCPSCYDAISEIVVKWLDYKG